MSGITIHHASDNRVLFEYKCDDNHILIDIKLSIKPNKKPESGIMELNKIFIRKVEKETEIKKCLMIIMERLLSTDDNDWILFSRNCVDFDYDSRDEYQENHMFILTNILPTNEIESIVGIIDEFNAESLYSIGSFTYDTEFQKIFYMEE